MTVATDYFNYQKAGAGHELYNKGEAPAIDDIQQYTLKRYGGQDLGSFGIRNIIGGSTISTHAFGAAWDWRYQNPGPGRYVLLNSVLPFFINNSQELGIQFIGDYVGCRIWKADRSGDANGGWKIQSPGSQMGQSWAQWIHFEIHPRVWHDARPLEEKLGVQGWPPFDPANGLFSLFPFNTNKPVTKLGAQGDIVKYLQGVMRKVGQAIAVDGGFGNITHQNVRWYQGTRSLTVDGVVGPQTWAAIDRDAKI